MDFAACMKTEKTVLMEGALGERLKREYGIAFDPHLDMAALVYSKAGRNALKELWEGYMAVAKAHNLPFMATTTTRRTNRERLQKTAYDDSIIVENVKFLRNIQKMSGQEMYVGALVGCRGDAYTGAGCLSQQESRVFHRWETRLFAEAGVDFFYAALMPTLEEAAGMTLAIRETGVPCILSFTIGADGCLVDGTPIAKAIETIDHLTEGYPTCYMTNCVHPDIVRQALLQPVNQCYAVRNRFRGIQANTARLPYSQLDGSRELITSDPEELARSIEALSEICRLKIVGGCCGTDRRHMEAIAKRLNPNDPFTIREE